MDNRTRVTMKSIIAFFYILQGQIVAYTVSEYETLRKEEDLPTWATCETLLEDTDFITSIREDLGDGEQVRAECYMTDDILRLGSPVASVVVTN